MRILISCGTGFRDTFLNIGIDRLVLAGILNALDHSDNKTCVECIKGKMTNKKNKRAERSMNVLELIRTDICGPFPIPSWNGKLYFITFIDDYSRYGYLYTWYMRSLRP